MLERGARKENTDCWRWNGGSYPMNATGISIEDFEALAEKDDDHIFFAGEACNSRLPGTLHDALILRCRYSEFA